MKFGLRILFKTMSQSIHFNANFGNLFGYTKISKNFLETLLYETLLKQIDFSYKIFAFQL